MAVKAITLVGGGSRSGKTAFALQRARLEGARLAYVATSETLDDEMRARAAAHRAERGAGFVTIEEPFDVAGVLSRQGSAFDAVVIDCLTVWLSNIMLKGSDPAAESSRLLEAAASTSISLVLVTNEVGCGIVPDNELARRFRDQAGWLNQRFAAAAREVYWMIFGCPLKVK